MKSPEAAFEYAAKYMVAPLEKGRQFVGLVARESDIHPAFARSPLKPKPFQKQFDVSLATKGGVVVVNNCGHITAEFCGRDPEPGDLVLVSAASYTPGGNPDFDYFVIDLLLTLGLTLNPCRFVPSLVQEKPA